MLIKPLTFIMVYSKRDISLFKKNLVKAVTFIKMTRLTLILNANLFKPCNELT